ncbi:MAG: sensor histidine kinase [Muribaculaceae bacterium]
MNGAKHIWRKLVLSIVVALMSLSTLKIVSQNNPFKIHDELFVLYKQAYKNRAKKSGLALADSMYNRAVELDDKKAACMALIVRMSYQFYHARTLHDFDVECNRLMQVSKANKQMQYFFYALSERGTFLLNNGESLLAIRNAKRIYDEAEKYDYNYGRLSYLTGMARVNMMQNDYDGAIEYFSHAYDYCKESLPDQDPATICLPMSNVYFNINDYKKSLEWAECGLAESKESGIEFRLALMKMRNLFKMKRFDDFMALYNKYEQQILETSVTLNVTPVRVERMLIDDKYDEAHELIALDTDSLQKLTMQSELMAHQGKFDKLFELGAMIFRTAYNINISSVQPFAMSEVEAAVNNLILRNEQLQLEYINARARLNNSLSAEQIAANKTNLMLMQLENDSIEVLGERLNNERAANERRTEEAKALVARKKAKDRKITTAIVTITAIIIILYGLLISVIQRRRRSEMKRKNLELKRHLEHATEADRMQNAFIENLGTDVERPLDCVVRCAAKIASASRLSKAEREACAEEIQAGSDRLTEIMSNLLSKSLADSTRSSKTATLIVAVAISCMAASAESRLSPKLTVSAHIKGAELERITANYIEKQLFYTAATFAYKCLNTAVIHDDHLSKYYAYKSIAEVSLYRYNRPAAIKYLNNAVEVCREHNIKVNLADEYMKLTRLSWLEGNYADAYRYVELYHSHCNTANRQVQQLAEHAIIDFCTMDTAAFRRHCAAALLKERQGTSLKPDNRTYLEALLTAIDGDADKAVQMLHQCPDKIVALRLITLIYIAEKNWVKATAGMRTEWSNWRKIRTQVFDCDRREMDAVAGNKLLEESNLKLQLDNALLEAKQHENALQLKSDLTDSLDLERRRITLEKARIKATTEREKTKAELAIAKAERLQENERMATVTMIMVIVTLLLIAAMIVRYYYMNRRDTKQLADKNQQIERAIALAELSDRQKREFMQSISHEIRTPLNSIVGFSQILLSDNNLSPEEQASIANTVEHNTLLLKKVMNDIAAMRDIDRLSLEKQSVCPELLCGNAMAMIEDYRHPDVPIVIAYNLPEDFVAHLCPQLITTVLHNLLLNAIRFTTQGEIRIGCNLTTEASELTFFVEDNGPGIPAEHSEDVFKMFYKLDSFNQGTGLGLSICRMVAQRMGADVKVDNSYTDGARLVMNVPIGL